MYRLDGIDGGWKRVSAAPAVLPGSQGDYDLAIAVDPNNDKLIFLGGDFFADQQLWPASIWQCRIRATATGFRMNSAPIGREAHADVHVLTHTPGDSDALWVGCDG